MGFKLSNKSKSRLIGVHPDMVALVNKAIEITTVDFGISEGVRTTHRQKELYRTGKSKTLNSRHLPCVSTYCVTGGIPEEIVGHAVDVYAWVNGGVNWEFSNYEKIYNAFKEVGQETNIEFVWGGHWTTLRDGPHFELSWKKYGKG